MSKCLDSLPGMSLDTTVAMPPRKSITARPGVTSHHYSLEMYTVRGLWRCSEIAETLLQSHDQMIHETAC